LPVVTSATEGRPQRPGEELEVRSSTVDDSGLRVASGLGREPLDGVEVRLLRLDPDLPPPSYAHPGDAGADLRTREDVTLQPGQRRVVPTGVAVALPEGFVGLVHPRSGLAARHGLTVVNAPGTVDAGYRGEIMVTLLNTDRSEPLVLRRGDRIAQLVVQRVERACFIEVEALPESVRGAGGFGSTGGFTGFAATSGPDTPVTPVTPAGHAQHEAGDSPGRGESS
jgi:dUTP pyrophosphatase